MKNAEPLNEVPHYISIALRLPVSCHWTGSRLYVLSVFRFRQSDLGIRVWLWIRVLFRRTISAHDVLVCHTVRSKTEVRGFSLLRCRKSFWFPRSFWRTRNMNRMESPSLRWVRCFCRCVPMTKQILYAFRCHSDNRYTCFRLWLWICPFFFCFWSELSFLYTAKIWNLSDINSVITFFNMSFNSYKVSCAAIT